ncbi:hypothetical protein BGZ97_010902, partial [Linnemannia gamsii]
MTDEHAQHYNAIKDVVLTDFLDKDPETTFKASDIWKDQPAIVGFRIVVVLHEKLGAATFKRDYWNGGETYFDKSKGFYKALG